MCEIRVIPVITIILGRETCFYYNIKNLWLKINFFFSSWNYILDIKYTTCRMKGFFILCRVSSSFVLDILRWSGWCWLWYCVALCQKVWQTWCRGQFFFSGKSCKYLKNKNIFLYRHDLKDFDDKNKSWRTMASFTDASIWPFCVYVNVCHEYWHAKQCSYGVCYQLELARWGRDRSA